MNRSVLNSLDRVFCYGAKELEERRKDGKTGFVAVALISGMRFSGWITLPRHVTWEQLYRRKDSTQLE
jgi:hypothetical protein